MLRRFPKSSHTLDKIVYARHHNIKKKKQTKNKTENKKSLEGDDADLSLKADTMIGNEDKQFLRANIGNEDTHCSDTMPDSTDIIKIIYKKTNIGIKE